MIQPYFLRDQRLLIDFELMTCPTVSAIEITCFKWRCFIFVTFIKVQAQNLIKIMAHIGRILNVCVRKAVTHTKTETPMIKASFLGMLSKMKIMNEQSTAEN